MAIMKRITRTPKAMIKALPSSFRLIAHFLNRPQKQQLTTENTEHSEKVNRINHKTMENTEKTDNSDKINTTN
jgi:hypothetical protein